MAIAFGLKQFEAFDDAILSYDESLQTQLAAIRDQVTTIHTLGPEGTNLCTAALYWLRKHEREGRVQLYTTVEDAIEGMPNDSAQALMTCAVYPDLHNVVFRNLRRLQFIDSFIYPTYSMLLASRDGAPPSRISTHPAPSCLVPAGAETILVTSNAIAARNCARGDTDGCITTQAAASAHGLVTVKDFGPVPMVYTLHGRVRQDR